MDIWIAIYPSGADGSARCREEPCGVQEIHKKYLHLNEECFGRGYEVCNINYVAPLGCPSDLVEARKYLPITITSLPKSGGTSPPDARGDVFGEGHML